jgi:hypothetical protein
MNWLGIATRPSVAMTAVNPSSSGMPAATSAPNASTRMTSVIGSDSVSAFLKSSLKDLSIALLALASPNWPTNTSGLSALTFATAAITGSTSFSVRSLSPLSWNLTSTERPSLETWPSLPLAYGDFTSDTPGLLLTAATAALTAARTAGSVALPPLGAWTRTCSSSRFGKWLSKSRSALPDWPM